MCNTPPDRRQPKSRRDMLEWLEDMTPAELSRQATHYANLARTAALKATREAFDRLSAECAALAAERADAETPRHVSPETPFITHRDRLAA
jgi:hypothetical protein